MKTEWNFFEFQSTKARSDKKLVYWQNIEHVKNIEKQFTFLIDKTICEIPHINFKI